MYKNKYVFHFILFCLTLYFLDSGKIYASCNNINFSSNKQNGCEPELIRFIAHNVPVGSTLRWDFGNGVITTNSDTIFRLYTNGGTYNVSLRVTLAGGQVCEDVEKVNLLNITPAPTPVMEISEAILCNGPTIASFEDKTLNSVSRDWIIDGQLYQDADKTVFHQFATTGVKSVTLKVTNAQGCSGTKTINDAVKIYNPPVIDVCANIIQTTDQTTAGFSPNVSNLSGRTITAYNWNLQGADQSSSSQTNPSAVYSDIYNSTPKDVTLEITLSDGCKTVKTFSNAMKRFTLVSNYTPCINEIINISNNSIGEGRTAYQWSLIGAGIISGNNLTGYEVRYNQFQKYNVSLSFKYGINGCTWNISMPEKISVQLPRANLNIPKVDRISCDDTLTVKLSSSSDLPPSGTTVYSWNIYDTSGFKLPNMPIGPGTENSTNYLFPRGTFDIELIVTNSNGCADTVKRSNYVSVGSPVADFEIEKNIYCIDSFLSVKNTTFPKASGDLKNKYAWFVNHNDSFNVYFEKESEDFGFIPQHLGYYNFRLIAENAIGCIDTKFVNNYIFIKGVQAKLTLNPEEGCPELSTQIQTKIYGIYPSQPVNQLTYEWEASGTYSNGFVFTPKDAPTTDFSIIRPGCYSPSLKIHSSECELTLSNEPVCAGVIAEFGYYEDVLCKKTYIKLKDSTFLSPETYKWSVSPSSAHFYPSDTVNEPYIYFEEDSCYDVQLIVTNQKAGLTCRDTIVKNLCTQSPDVNFEVDQTYFECAPVIANFTNLSENAIDYDWYYGDGGKLNSGLMNVSYTYETNNPYGFDVTLVAIDKDGCTDTITKYNLIEVIGPVPYFTTDYVSSCDSASVIFTDKSEFVTAYLFDYGDGTSADSNAMNPHLYEIRDDADGDTITYFPTLIVRDEFDCIAYFRDSIMLFNSPKVDFEAEIPGGCVPADIPFYSSSEFTFKYLWDFNNNGIVDNDSINPVFTYQDTGLYDVVLIGIGAGNCSDTIIKKQYIEVIPKPVAKMKSDHNGIICGDQNVLFENLSLDFNNFIIDYGINGLKDTNKISEITYHYDFAQDKDSVIFYPSLSVFNQYGCTDVFTDTLILYKAVEAGIYFENNQSCENVMFEFFNNSLGASNWQWDFNSDNVINSTEENPRKMFEPGSYFVTLIAGNPYGCFDTITSEEAIVIMPIPNADFIFSDSSICPEESITFTDISTGQYQLNNWQWDFGNIHDPDNNNWNGQNPPPYQYNVPGFYSVRLILTDENGCIDTNLQINIIFVFDSTLPNPPEIRWVSMTDNYRSEIIWSQNPYTGFIENRLYLSSQQLMNDTLIHSTVNHKDTVFTHDFIPVERPLCYHLITEKKCELISNPSVVHCAMHLEATELNSNSNLISWTPYIGWGNQLDRYELYFNTDGSSVFEFLSEISPADTSFIHDDLCDFNYCYIVKAISTEQYTSVSNTVCNQPPYKYQNFALELYKTTVVENKHILTEWEKGIQPNIKRYLIDRMDTSSIWENEYAETEDNFFIDKYADIHNQYYTYRIRVEDACQNVSPYSNIGRSILLKTGITEDMINLYWNSYLHWPGDVLKYQIDLFHNRTREFNEVTQLVASAREFTDLDVYPEIDTSYCYRITAIENSPEPHSSTSNISCALLTSRIFIPSAFSPDGNEVNEVFKVRALSILNQIGDPAREFQMLIYDRWGSKIYETNDLHEGWDGSTINGKAASAGVYIYIIKAVGVNGVHLNLSGSVTLIR